MGYRLEIKDKNGNYLCNGTKLFGYIPSELSYKSKSLKYLWETKAEELNRELEEDGSGAFEDYEEFVDCICFNTDLPDFVRLTEKELDQFLDLYDRDREKWKHFFPWEYQPIKDKIKFPIGAEYVVLGWE